jgi:Zn-dependent peptidase ImmA (M78 family)
MNWREAHAEALFAASQAHDELEIETTRQIDVFSAIASLGLDLIFRPLHGASGLFFPGPTRAESGVLVTSNHRLARQRFTAAHELGHFWLEHVPRLDLNTEVLARDAMSELSPDEMVAEAFAAWFLMPPELVDAALGELGVESVGGPEDVYGLSLRMGTSYSATAYHLPNLRLIDYETANRWAKEPPKRVKASLSRGVEMESYFSDVWSLTERDSDRGFRVQAGDRLVVTLPEIPSSGYMWRAEELPREARVVADTMNDSLAVADTQGSLLYEEERPPGGTHPRILIVDLGQATGHGDVRLVKAPVWAPDSSADQFRVHVDIEAPLLGRVLATAQ